MSPRPLVRFVSLATALLVAGAAAAAETARIPDFSSSLWNRGLGPFEKPPSGPGPVQNPPDIPFVFRNNRSNYVGDASNPILQPWAAERVRAQTKKELDGHEAGTAQQTCRPSGIPGIFQLNDTVKIIQRPDVVLILYARGHQWRVIHLNQKHPENLKPSWYGHSIGHYEGDTLVVDTIRLNDKPWADRYGTPQTERMHVIERYRLVPNPRGDGQMLQAHFFVEDPGAFTMPWSAIANYRAGAAFASGFDEQICQENNRELGPEIEPLVPRETYKYPF
jgi:hypothetical protein